MGLFSFWGGTQMNRQAAEAIQRLANHIAKGAFGGNKALTLMMTIREARMEHVPE